MRGQPPKDEWFVVNVHEDAPWLTNGVMGDACVFESDERTFGQIGYTLAVLQPGQASGMYHHEQDQEDFLVLAGECLLLIDGQERPLRRWDFVHCPPGTDHIFVGAGHGPCAIFMAGARQNKGLFYPRSELALRHGAGVEVATAKPAEAYAQFPKWRSCPPVRWE